MPDNNEPNHPITLLETNIIDIDGQPVDVPVNVVFQMFPYPRVVIESDQLPHAVLQKERFKISMRNGAQLDAMCLVPPVLNSRGSLIPARLPADVMDKKVPLKSIRFSILNYPRFYGMQDRWVETETGSTRTPHLKLEASGWCVEINGVENMTDVLNVLNRDGGYGFTYDGIVTRADDATFSIEEVDTLLEALRMFLSFAKGNYCSLSLVEGEDELGERTWARWGAHYVPSWKARESWILRNAGGDILAELFPKFVSLFEGGSHSRETVARALDWYLTSNESAVHVGLILTEAALERLAYHVLGSRRGSTGEFIEVALKKLNLDTNIPQECKELRNQQTPKKWTSGPHAIDDIRNDLVHPQSTLGNVSAYAHHEAWNLGQWYIEMVLLNELCYQGSYKNRLSDWEGRSNVIQPVPWAQGCENS